MINDPLLNDYMTLPKELIDRRQKEASLSPVDVIIPILNTNPLWKRNLFNYYERIPINRLLVGDAGCTDGSIEIAKQFPRVTVYDHSNFKTLGYSLRKLMEAVQSDWFIYLHSDVFLPQGWFEAMTRNQNQYDWFECNQRNSILIDYLSYDHANKIYGRAYSGGQMGRKKAFNQITSRIDDDFLYRNEDIIFAELIESSGFKYGRTADTYIHHQLMSKNGEKEPKIESISLQRATDLKWEQRTADMQTRGLIKYLSPSLETIDNVLAAIREMKRLGAFDKKEFVSWVAKTNPAWNSTVRRILWILAFQESVKATKRLLKSTLKKLFFPAVRNKLTN